jgi:hypothetical protein
LEKPLRKKRGYLRVTALSEVRTGVAVWVYLRERLRLELRPLDPLRLRGFAPPRARAVVRLLPPDFREPVFFADFLAPLFREAVFFAPLDFFLEVGRDLELLRPPEAFRALDFPAPDDRDEVEVVELLLGIDGVRAAEVEPLPNPLLPLVEVPPAPAPVIAPEEVPPKLVPPRPGLLVPPLLPSPPPVSVDSCRLPDPLGRPLLPLGAPPPKRSSSSSSSSPSSSATTVASESTSSSSSASSALSQRRSLWSSLIAQPPSSSSSSS